MRDPVVVADHPEAREVAILHELLAAHRSMVLGALHVNPELDVERAFEVHARLARVLANWDHYSVQQHREIVATVHYVVDADDETPDLTGPDGFRDDLDRVRELTERLER